MMPYIKQAYLVLDYSTNFCTTVAGLAPLLLSPSFGAQFVIPMAISVAFGLIFITVIILVLLPIFIIATNRIKVYAKWFWEGKKPSYESVEKGY